MEIKKPKKGDIVSPCSSAAYEWCYVKAPDANQVCSLPKEHLGPYHIAMYHIAGNRGEVCNVWEDASLVEPSPFEAPPFVIVKEAEEEYAPTVFVSPVIPPAKGDLWAPYDDETDDWCRAEGVEGFVCSLPKGHGGSWHVPLVSCVYDGNTVGKVCGNPWKDPELPGGPLPGKVVLKATKGGTAKTKSSVVILIGPMEAGG